MSRVKATIPMFPWLAAEYAVAAGHRVYRPDPSPCVNDRQPSWVEWGRWRGWPGWPVP
jgi:hypothetical protein